MADKMTYISQAGLDKLKIELHELKSVRRRELAERIDEARQQGDLSENAEYHDAREALAFCEGRIQEIEAMLKNVSVISATASSDVVRIGSSIVAELQGKKKEYTIVGSNEADPVAGRISNESPLGYAFLGHHVGDDVSVETPVGVMIYSILEIR